MADLFCDNVSMLIRELLLAYMLPGKIFNLIALWTEKHCIFSKETLNCIFFIFKILDLKGQFTPK